MNRIKKQNREEELVAFAALDGNREMRRRLSYSPAVGGFPRNQAEIEA
jgi:hypothetical protein